LEATGDGEDNLPVEAILSFCDSNESAAIDFSYGMNGMTISGASHRSRWQTFSPGSPGSPGHAARFGLRFGLPQLVLAAARVVGSPGASSGDRNGSAPAMVAPCGTISGTQKMGMSMAISCILTANIGMYMYNL